MTQHNIAIVDDDEDDRSFLEEAFMQLGVTDDLSLYASGEQFLASLYTIEKLPVLTILDYNMPVLTGEAVLIEMKKHPHFSNTKVIILSTGMHEELKNRLQALGAYCCISKPYTPAGYAQLALQLKNVAIDLINGTEPDMSAFT
jgi:CheY-like chemotaxis protein